VRWAQAADGDDLDVDVEDARTALDWGLVNRVVPDDELDAAVDDLLARTTPGSRASKALGKQTLYAQLDRPEADVYTVALEVMASASQLPGGNEGIEGSSRSARQPGRTDLVGFLRPSAPIRVSWLA